MSLDAALLEVIACPVCRGSLSEADAPAPDTAAAGGVTSELVCAGCRRAYPVRDGIPVLLADHARQE
jgi:uncharacterized protein